VVFHWFGWLEAFLINGEPTYKGRTWNGKKIEGLLMNSRMVQGTFDDLNPRRSASGPTRHEEVGRRAQHPRVRRRHARVAQARSARRHAQPARRQPAGVLEGQPWHNSAITADGSLRPEYMARLEKVLDTADELGMVVILGLFYFGQDERLKDEEAVKRGVDNALDWLTEKGYRNVLIEVNNECNVRYDHAILQAGAGPRADRARAEAPRRFLVSTSYGGGTIPKENVVKASDFLLLHGNGVSKPERIAEMVRQTRKVPGYRPMPILFNEDDHFDFDKPLNNFVAAVGEYASWGYFDYRMKGEGFDDGYQSVPVNWGISSPRKKGFFKLLTEITGGTPG
jgi:hypothetical protein